MKQGLLIHPLPLTYLNGILSSQSHSVFSTIICPEAAIVHKFSNPQLLPGNHTLIWALSSSS